MSENPEAIPMAFFPPDPPGEWLIWVTVDSGIAEFGLTDPEDQIQRARIKQWAMCPGFSGSQPLVEIPGCYPEVFRNLLGTADRHDRTIWIVGTGYARPSVQDAAGLLLGKIQAVRDPDSFDPPTPLEGDLRALWLAYLHGHLDKMELQDAGSGNETEA